MAGFGGFSALRDKARRGFRGYPVATVAYYGPDAGKATKIAVGIILKEGDEPVALKLPQCDGEHPLAHPVDRTFQLGEAHGAAVEQRDGEQRPLVGDAVEDLADLAVLAGVPLVGVPGVGSRAVRRFLRSAFFHNGRW